MPSPIKIEVDDESKRVLISKSVLLWDLVNESLERDDLESFWITLNDLVVFNTQNKLSPEAMLPSLTNHLISEKSKALLDSIYSSLGSYARATSIPEDSSIEVSFVSGLNVQFGYFLDCFFSRNERLSTEEKTEISRPQIIIKTMEHIKNSINNEVKIGDISLKKLLEFKIFAIQQLDFNDPSIHKLLEPIYSLKNLKNNYILGKSPRNHYYELNAHDFNISSSYKNLKGDALKVAILNDFRLRIDLATNKNELHNIVDKLKNSNEYKVLLRGQGLATRFFHLKTSSIKAFEKMIKKADDKLPGNENVPK